MRAITIGRLAALAAVGISCHLVLPHAPNSRSGPEAGVDQSQDHAPDDLAPGDLAPGHHDTALKCSQLTLTIDTAENDGEFEGHTGKLTSAGETVNPPLENGIYIGFWNNFPSWGYFRFRLPEAIPAGAKIASATLDLRGICLDQWDAATDALQVSLEASADAPVVDDGSAPDKPDGRPLIAVAGQPYVRWPAQGGLAWKIGVDNRTPELAPLVGALHAQKGSLPGGAHLQFWLRGERQSGAAEVTTTVFERGGELARLNLEWCVP